jgi:uncharacterized membrane protein
MTHREPLPSGTSALARIVHKVERNRTLDKLDAVPSAVADALLASRRRRNLLQGRWMGHAVHPLLTDVPIGMWTSASALDLIGGPQSRDAAERLLALGIAAAVPTAVTGLAEWGETRGPDRRVGFVHALTNGVALGLYGASLASRRRGDHRRGALLGLAGGMVAGVGGYLGGHLTLARKVASPHPEFESAAL